MKSGRSSRDANGAPRLRMYTERTPAERAAATSVRSLSPTKIARSTGTPSSREDCEDHRGIGLAPAEVRRPCRAADVLQDSGAPQNPRVVIARHGVVRDDAEREVARQVRHDGARVRVGRRRRLPLERAEQEPAHDRSAVGEHLVHVRLQALALERPVGLAQSPGALDHERLRVADAVLLERRKEVAIANRALVALQLGEQNSAHVEQDGIDSVGAHQDSGVSTGSSCALGLRTSRRETQIDIS